MPFSSLRTYAQTILSYVPWWHWAVMVVLALTVSLLFRKKLSTYGTIALGLTVFVVLFLLDTAVVIRFFGALHHKTGYELSFQRLIHPAKQARIEHISNIAVFAPFGFFLAEFLATRGRFGDWRWIGLATLAAFGLSLCIECLQLFLRVGFFELTDLVMNTVGGFLGASLSAVGRCLFKSTDNHANP